MILILELPEKKWKNLKGTGHRLQMKDFDEKLETQLKPIPLFTIKKQGFRRETCMYTHKHSFFWKKLVCFCPVTKNGKDGRRNGMSNFMLRIRKDCCENLLSPEHTQLFYQKHFTY